MVMKSLKHAMKRATPIIAEYLGGAVSCNVYCMTDSRADGFGVSSCILSSLEDARVSPEKKVQAIVVKSNFNPVRNYEELMLSIPQHHGSVKLVIIPFRLPTTILSHLFLHFIFLSSHSALFCLCNSPIIYFYDVI
ncbi:hypothetical protein P3S68_007772 [Capsicum galapagoense]